MYTSEYSLERPAGLRRRSLPMGTVLWRIDADHPSSWEWNSYPSPRHRFDSATRTFRTRYGAQTMLGAARERYLDTGLLIPDDHSDHWWPDIDGIIYRSRTTPSTSYNIAFFATTSPSTSTTDLVSGVTVL